MTSSYEFLSYLLYFKHLFTNTTINKCQFSQDPDEESDTHNNGKDAQH